MSSLNRALCAAASVSALASVAAAQDDDVAAAVLRGRLELFEAEAAQTEEFLETEIASQRGEIEALKAANRQQAARIDGLAAQLQAVVGIIEGQAVSAAASAQPAAPEPREAPTRTVRPEAAVQVAEAPRPAPQPQGQAVPEQVGQAPREEVVAPAVDLFAGLGGVLTPKGVGFAETGVRYSTSSDNRFFFSGLELVDALLIGVLEARDTDRTTLSASQGLRYGLTDRLEIEATVPFVYQEDRVADVAVSNDTSGVQERSGSGIGDVTFGLHYQLNRGRRWPYLIANLRAKAPTGQGIFDVDDDEAPTGSGYWSLEPSLTFIKRSDPVVLFGNVGYQFNFATDLDFSTEEVAVDGFRTDDRTVLTGAPAEDIEGFVERLTTTTLTEFTEFNAGDALRTSFGLGLALNEAVSLNFGYDQSYVFAGETDILVSSLTVGQETGTFVRRIDPERVLREGQDVTVGSFLFGLAYRPAPRLRVNLTTSVGATEEAPDVNVSLRTQYRF
jgi:hypothetical protein